MGFFVGELSPESYKQALVHRLLKPTISGNTINWLGEKNRRLPAPVYWHNPTKTPYGWLNLLIEIRAWFKWSLPTVGIENMKLQRRRLSPIITNKATGSPGHWSALVKSFAIEHEAVFRLLRRALIRDLLINPIDNVQEIPRIFCCDTYNSLGLHGPFRPDRFVNVTNVWEKKVAAINAHESEPIPFFLDMINRQCLAHGKTAGTKRAEGFLHPHLFGFLDYGSLLGS